MSSLAKIILLSGSGAIVGAIVWAWLAYGSDVALAYASGLAMTCF